MTSETTEATKGGINLANLDVVAATEGVVYDLELLHPLTEDPLGLFIQIKGTYSAEFRKASRDQTNELLLRDFESRRNAKKAKPPTVEDGDRRSSKLLAANTVGWFQRHPAPIGGEPRDEPGLPFGETRLMFSVAEAEKLYASPGYDWVAKQVDKGMGELAHFMKS
jgi:hypothetical protein